MDGTIHHRLMALMNELFEMRKYHIGEYPVISVLDESFDIVLLEIIIEVL